MTSKAVVVDVEDPDAADTYDKLRAAQCELEHLIYRARYHGEHASALSIFENIKTHLDDMVYTYEGKYY